MHVQMRKSQDKSRTNYQHFIYEGILRHLNDTYYYIFVIKAQSFSNIPKIVCYSKFEHSQFKKIVMDLQNLNRRHLQFH